MILKAFDDLPQGAGWNDSFCILVDNEFCSAECDTQAFFNPRNNDEVYVIKDKDLWDVLVRLGCYASRSAASSDGRYPRKFEDGYKEYEIGKKKVKIFVYSATKNKPVRKNLFLEFSDGSVDELPYWVFGDVVKSGMFKLLDYDQA